MNLKKQHKMILLFSPQNNAHESFFVEKIMKGLVLNKLIAIDRARASGKIEDSELKPILHSMREDKNNRWKSGKIINFFINLEAKNKFQFAPRLPVVSTQDVQIIYNKFGKPIVFIDGKIFYMQDWSLEQKYKMLHFAHHEGFDTTENFFNHYNNNFKGKIIHWTNLRY